jgi:hypothetical protein
MSREDELIVVLNKILEVLKPLKYEDLNNLFPEGENGSLERIEREDTRIGIRPITYASPEHGWCVSTLSILATITDVLVDKRLALQIDDNGFITGFQWYEDPEEEKQS